MSFRSRRHARHFRAILLTSGLLALAGGVRADELPSLVIGDAAAAEPPVGSGVVSMLVSLSAPVAAAVTATFETRPDTATATDFTPLTGVVEIVAGATRGMIRIPVLADPEAEETEQFFVKLSDVQGAVLARSEGRATVLNAGSIPVVWSEPALLYEDGPPDPKPLWVEGGGNGPITIQWRLQELPAAPDLGWSPATAGADFDVSLRSVTGRGRVPLSMMARSDDVVEPGDVDSSREKVSLRFHAASPVGYASYVPEFVGDLAAEELGPPMTIKTPVATTDGEWVAFGLRRGTHLALYRRGRGMDGTWQQAPSFELGPGVTFTEMIMRRGRLAVSTSRGMALYEAPNGPGVAAWATVNPPPESGELPAPIPGNAHAGFSFDGDSLIVRKVPPGFPSPQRLEFLERMAPSGGWAIVQEELQPEGVFIQSVAVEGDTAFVATGATDAPLVEYRRTGPAERPWVRRATLQPPPPPPDAGRSYGYSVLALCSGCLHARHYGDLVQESLMFRLHESGEWRIEQRSLPPFSSYDEVSQTSSAKTTFISPGVLVHGNILFARTGPVSEPWRQVGYALQFVPINDAQNGVLLQRNSQGPLPRIVASAPGAALTLFDEDSAFWRLENPITGGAPSPFLDEPPSGGVDASLTLSGPLVPFAVSVEARLTPASTATPGVDFVGPPLRIDSLRVPGFNPARLPLSIMADPLAEDPETLGLELHSPSYGRILDPNPIVFTIRDRRSALTTPSSIVTMVEPDSGHLDYVIPCRLSIPLTVDTSLPFSIESLGATRGQDFAVPPTVLVPAGTRSCAIPVRVLADSNEESIETFYVRLGAASGVSIASPSVHVHLLDRFVPGRGTEADAYAVPQNAAFSAGAQGDAAPGVGANDAGPAGIVRLTHAPPIGVLALDPSGRFAYTPPTNFLGTTTFSYEARLGDGPGALVTAGAAWKYLHPLDGVDPAVAAPTFPTTWTTPGFVDSAWSTGSGMLGYGGLGATNVAPDTVIGTPPSGSRYTAYFRHTFDAPGTLTADLVAEFSCDDAAIFYINGQEVGRFSHFADPAFATAADTYRLLAAAGSVENAAETAVQTLSFRGVRLLPTGNVFAVSVHNWATVSSDFGFRFVALNAVERWSQPTPVTLVVTDQAVPPVLQPDAYVCAQGGSLDTALVVAGGVFENDGLLNAGGAPFDPILETERSPSVAGGQLTRISDSGDFRYTPPPEYYGPDSFVYHVRDKDGWSASVMVSIDVQPSNEYDQWRLSELGAIAPTPATEPDQSINGYGPTNLESYFYFLGTSDPRPAGPSPLELVVDPDGRTGVRFTGRFLTDVITTVEATSALETGGWDPLARWQGVRALFVGPNVSLIPNAGPDNQFLRQFVIFELPPLTGPRYYRVRIALPDPAP